MQALVRPSAGKLCSRLFLTPKSLPLIHTYPYHLNLRTRYRHFTSTRYVSNSLTSNPVIDAKKLGPTNNNENDLYHGPLTTTFRRLKIFSLASLGLSVTLAPFMFILESNLPVFARLALVSIALGSSSVSTALVSWCAKPYVITLRRSYADDKGGAEEIELTTVNLFLQPRITKLYDPSFLIETHRPLAKWELAREVALSSNSPESEGSKAHPVPGQEETIAETMNQNGEIIGRWIVKWKENGVGTCHQMGHVIRYFNVHEELLR